MLKFAKVCILNPSVDRFFFCLSFCSFVDSFVCQSFLERSFLVCLPFRSFVLSFVRSFVRPFVRSLVRPSVIQFIVSHSFVCLFPLSFVFLILFICFVTICVDVTLLTFSFRSWLAVVIQKKARVTEGIPKATPNIQRDETK